MLDVDLRREKDIEQLRRVALAQQAQILAMVTDPKSVARYLRGLGESTEAPPRTAARGPPYWQSRVLRRGAVGDEAAGSLLRPIFAAH